MSASKRLAELGITLPEVPTPVASYQPAVRVDNRIYVSGQVPRLDGELTATGRLGADVSVQAGAEAAEVCALNAIAAAAEVAGGIDNITQVIKVVGYVAATPDFTQQPQVINGASDLIGKIFGDAGAHARAAVGVASLPLGVPVEVEMIVAVK
ncbi:MAG: RidA family protein [Bowdeniella nasicola]|nr:RidA family protein [Bowdeniella nasicola]